MLGSAAINLHRLKLLCEVSDRGSLSAAAAALSYSTSSVSEQISLLEQEVGLQLLERGRRGVRLTPAGETVVDRARDLLAHAAALSAEVEDLAGLRSGRLRLGAFPTAGSWLLPRAVARFRSHHPAIELALVEADPDDALAALRAREVDMALAYRFEAYEPGDADDHDEVELLVDELRVVLPGDHRLSERTRVALSALRDDPWIQGVRRGSTIDILPAACRAAGFEPRIAFQTDDVMAVQGFVAAGLGVALVSQLVRPLVRDDVIARTLRPALRRVVFAALPRGLDVSPAAAAMLDALSETAASGFAG